MRFWLRNKKETRADNRQEVSLASSTLVETIRDNRSLKTAIITLVAIWKLTKEEFDVSSVFPLLRKILANSKGQDPDRAVCMDPEWNAKNDPEYPWIMDDIRVLACLIFEDVSRQKKLTLENFPLLQQVAVDEGERNVIRAMAHNALHESKACKCFPEKKTDED